MKITEIDEKINLLNIVILDFKKLYRKKISINIEDLNKNFITKINLYIQINLRRFSELLESISLNAQYKLKLPAILSARACLETVALFCAFKNEFESKIKHNQYDEVHRIIDKYIRITLDQEYLSGFESEEDKMFYKSTNILTLIKNKLGKIVPEAVTDYEYLSNKVHPNFEGVFGLYAFHYENHFIEFDSSFMEKRNNDEILKIIRISCKYGAIFCKYHDDIAILTKNTWS
jgi:hypothetical protein